MNTFIYKCIHAHTFIYCIFILKSHTFILHSSLLSLLILYIYIEISYIHTTFITPITPF